MSLESLTHYEELLKADMEHIWHPYTQAKVAPLPLLVKSAQAEFINIIDNDTGEEKKLIDGISSWWVNIHGHAHPYINEAIKKQIDNLEHVIFAGFTHEPAIKLIEKLLPLLPKTDITNNYQTTRILNKAFFSDNGSTAVEVAIKMAIQYWHNRGHKQRSRIIAFKGGYHGDTIGTMSPSDTPVFHQAFKKVLFPVDFAASPADGEEESLSEVKDWIALHGREKIAAIVIEPLVQGAGGMKFHSEKFLQNLRKLCDEYGIFLIADEVFTGFGRTGHNFACEKAMVVPDMICLSKGLTGGYLPMGLTITTDEIYSAFYDESRMKTFFHGHSFTGNPLACTAALASLELYEKEDRLKDVSYINSQMNEVLNTAGLRSLPYIKDIRIMGAIAAIEFDEDYAYPFKQEAYDQGERTMDKEDVGPNKSSYLADIGPYLYNEFFKRQIYLRPLGNVLYFLPPYCISVKSLDYCLSTIKEVITQSQGFQL